MGLDHFPREHPHSIGPHSPLFIFSAAWGQAGPGLNTPSSCSQSSPHPAPVLLPTCPSTQLSHRQPACEQLWKPPVTPAAPHPPPPRFPSRLDPALAFGHPPPPQRSPTPPLGSREHHPGELSLRAAQPLWLALCWARRPHRAPQQGIWGPLSGTDWAPCCFQGKDLPSLRICTQPHGGAVFRNIQFSLGTAQPGHSSLQAERRACKCGVRTGRSGTFIRDKSNRPGFFLHRFPGTDRPSFSLGSSD